MLAVAPVRAHPRRVPCRIPAVPRCCWSAAARRDAAPRAWCHRRALLPSEKVPCLPVNPWQITPGVTVDQNAHGVPLCSQCHDPCARHRFRSAGRRDRESAAGEHCTSLLWRLVPSSRTTTGHLDPHLSSPPLITPSAIRSQRTMPPKIFTSTATHPGVGEDQLERRGHLAHWSRPAGRRPGSSPAARGAA